VLESRRSTGRINPKQQFDALGSGHLATRRQSTFADGDVGGQALREDRLQCIVQAGLDARSERRVTEPTPPAAHTFYLWQDLAIHMGSGIPSDLHRHFPVQICLALDGLLALRGGTREPWRFYTAALIPSGAWHQTEMRLVQLVMIYLDPLSPVVRSPYGWTRNIAGISAVPQARAERAIANLRTGSNQPAAIRSAIEELLRRDESNDLSRVDGRVTRAISIMESEFDSPPALPEVAQRVGLSASRFRHVFREETGSTFSAYRLWAQVVHACRRLATRPDLTRAAHDAGFADSAHFSRAFHRTFGLRPSDIFKSSEFRLVICD
jgi:AraC-like DNA-binding protein